MDGFGFHKQVVALDGRLCGRCGVSRWSIQVPDYALLRPIGTGSYGDVWLARSVTGQWRAVKVVHRDRFESDRPFEREFEGIRRFEGFSHRHPSQLRVLHVGRSSGGDSFHYVMELADPVEKGSPTPGEVGFEPDRYTPRTLRTERERRGYLPVVEAIQWGIVLAEALEVLHAEGLIHRDIKPSNIIFVGGQPKLADIGLITAAEMSSTFVGTEGFVPPEGPGSRAADLFALGKVLYEIATGCDRTRFPSLPEDHDSRPDRSLLMELNEVWLKACDPDANRRHSSAAALAADLRSVGHGRSLRRWRQVERRLRWVTGAGIVAAVLAVAAGGLGYWANRERLRARQAEREVLVKSAGQQVALARANRESGRVGQRLETLSMLEQVGPEGDADGVRREWLAARALPDVARIERMAESGVNLELDPNLRRYATNDLGGAIHVRGWPTHGLETVIPALLLESGRPVRVFGHGFSTMPGFYGASYWNRMFVAWPLGKEKERVEAQAIRFQLPLGARAGVGVPGETLLLATDGMDGAMHLFDARRGQEIGKVSDCRELGRLAFRADGVLFAQWSEDRVRIREVGGGKVIREWATSSPVMGVCWHPDGVQLATWSNDRFVRLWNSGTGMPSGLFAGHDAAVVGVAFEDRGEFMISMGWDDQAVVWSVARQQEMLRVPLAGNGLRFARDGSRFAAQRWRDSAWTAAELVRPEVLRLEPHPDSAGVEGNRDLWRLEQLDNGLLVGVGNQGVNLWRPELAGFGVFLRWPMRHALVSVPGGGLVTVDGEAAWLRRIHWRGPGFAPEVSQPQRMTPSTIRGVDTVAATLDGSRMAVVTQEGQLHVQWESGTNGWVRWETKPVVACSLDAVGRRLGAVMAEGGAEVWDVASRRRLARMEGRQFLNGALSPDGRWWAAGDVEWMGVWEVDSGILVHERSRRVRAGCNFAWSTDATRMVVQDDDGEAVVLVTGEWREACRMPAPPMMRAPLMNSGVLALPGEKSGVELWPRSLLASAEAGRLGPKKK